MSSQRKSARLANRASANNLPPVQGAFNEFGDMFDDQDSEEIEESTSQPSPQNTHTKLCIIEEKKTQ